MSAKAKFNRDDVISKAKNLYWEKGYHATSMRNLQDVVDMRPGSIYAAFGSKDNLFSEALNHYALENAEQLANCMAQENTVLGGLKRFIRSVTLCDKGSVPSGMCMIVKSVAELTQNDSPVLLANAKAILAKVEGSLAQIFQRAKDNGEISAAKDPVELACYLQVQLIGLRTYAQATDNIVAVEKLIDDLFEALP
ncbi:TetR/AcrR family transcriptional regulator [Paraglaciecola polaris]|uniref:Transcriptional regulator TetR family n=1 Tax=Paraglaciecola polaris LMG 21857 TaxID=1129793 RepID=K7A696_9ALTE|nr:TetR/AcrR family transcriptional regulator [Paraglaciecola polaris]GAC31000.1 transcriptional regulator TetR family [Paraglaciecola polaris LMG 21857]|tara:strand:+ start:466 stop:1050 length:585 start_codon:yes stop_codon:yes gene_type:complete